MADPMNTEQLAELAAPVHAYLELRAAELAAPAIEQAERESAYYERALPDLKSEFRRQWNSSEKRMAAVTRERDDARAEIARLREELAIARDAFEIPQHEAVKAQAEAKKLREFRDVVDHLAKDARSPFGIARSEAFDAICRLVDGGES